MGTRMEVTKDTATEEEDAKTQPRQRCDMIFLVGGFFLVADEIFFFCQDWDSRYKYEVAQTLSARMRGAQVKPELADLHCTSLI